MKTQSNFWGMDSSCECTEREGGWRCNLTCIVLICAAEVHTTSTRGAMFCRGPRPWRLFSWDMLPSFQLLIFVPGTGLVGKANGPQSTFSIWCEEEKDGRTKTTVTRKTMLQEIVAGYISVETRSNPKPRVWENRSRESGLKSAKPGPFPLFPARSRWVCSHLKKIKPDMHQKQRELFGFGHNSAETCACPSSNDSLTSCAPDVAQFEAWIAATESSKHQLEVHGMNPPPRRCMCSSV